MSLLAHYDAEARAGHMSQAAAQEAALGAVRSLRYGQNDYFWINDLHAKVIMHPIKPAFDGTDGALVRDVNGVSPFVRAAEAARTGEGGTFEYRWPRAGSTVPTDKISYAKTFAPWVVGTGVYVDDITAGLRAQMVRSGSEILLVGLGVTGLALLIGRDRPPAVGDD